MPAAGEGLSTPTVARDGEGLRLELINLGCKVNQAEGRGLARRLAGLGFRVEERWDRPAVSVINACAVTAASEAKARKEAARARKRGSSIVVLTGCMAGMGIEGWRREAMPDLVVPQDRKEELPEILLASLPQAAKKLACEGGRPSALRDGAKAKAFLKVQDGCGHPCAYCVVPRLRGKPVSLPMERVLREVKRSLEEGAGEIVLCGINLGAWEDGEGGRLDRLAAAVLKMGEGFRLRLSSLDPQDLDGDLLDGLKGLDRLCPHFHLPLQSGSDGVLRAMGRGYRAADFLGLVKEVRGRWEGCAVTTDVMVGFPGEGEGDFRDTLDLLEEVRPSRMHVFRYSPRPGTAAEKMDGQVDEAVKRDRAAEAACLGARFFREYALSQAGRTLELLVEGTGATGEIRGTTENYLKARMAGVSRKRGCLVLGRVETLKEGMLLMRSVRGAEDGPSASSGSSGG